MQDRIILSAFDLRPGLRHDHYRRTLQDTATYTLNAAYEGLPARSSESRFSPKVLAEFDVTPGFTLYGQCRRRSARRSPPGCT